jgi:hypothetical protein
MLGANAPRILDAKLASCKENLQQHVNKTQRVDFLELFPKIRDPLNFLFIYFRYPLPKFLSHLFKTIIKFSIF